MKIIKLNLLFFLSFSISLSDILTQDQRTARLQNVIKQISMLRVDAFEAACMKALILFRPGSIIYYSTQPQAGRL